MIGDYVARANHLRDIVNRRPEKNTCGYVVILEERNEHRIKDHRYGTQHGYCEGSTARSLKLVSTIAFAPAI